MSETWEALLSCQPPNTELAPCSLIYFVLKDVHSAEEMW